MGAVMPEALAAWEELKEDVPGLGLLAITSPDLLHRGWTDRAGGALAGASETRATSSNCWGALLRMPALSRSPTQLPPRCPGSAASSASASRRLASRSFGQTGSLADLYAAYRLDGDAITEAVAELLLPA